MTVPTEPSTITESTEASQRGTDAGTAEAITETETMTAVQFLGGPFTLTSRELPTPLEPKFVIGGRDYPESGGHYLLAHDGVTYAWVVPDPFQGGQPRDVAPTEVEAAEAVGEHVRPARRTGSRRR